MANPARTKVPWTHVLIAVQVGFVLATAVWTHVAPTRTYGTSSEVVLDGRHTGVWRLAVASRPALPFEGDPSADIRSTDPAAEPSQDQLESAADGWSAACATLTAMRGGLPSEECRRSRRPEVGIADTAHGLSGGLAEALGAWAHLSGHDSGLVVAATGQLYETYGGHPQAPPAPLGVHEIAGVTEKAAAVRALGADVVFVPRANAVQFTRLLPDTRVVGVSTVTEAALELCALDGSCAQLG